MSETREVVVMFVDVCDSTKLYEVVGDAKALEAIKGCVKAVQSAVEEWSGRVVKHIGDGIMAVFPDPKMAVVAASCMQSNVDVLPLVAGAAKLAIKIGMQYGPVIQQGEDVFGDTVNTAARLLQKAAKSQIILSAKTASLLPAEYGAMLRPLQAVQVKGKTEEIELCELIWKTAGDMTISQPTKTIRIKVVTLRLLYEGSELMRRRLNETVVIGRDAASNIVVSSTKASRRHCLISRRGEKYILLDESTNGTFVTPEGQQEIELHREEYILGGHGWIAIGLPREEAEAVVEYWVIE